MSSASKIIQAAAGNAGEALYVEDVFSTYLYEGDGSTQTITNGIDLDGEGGLVWIKNRDAGDSHVLTDTERGATEILSSDSTAAEATDADTLTGFNSDGFAIGADVKVNTNTEDYASWTFRKAPKFFDVVTYTGNRTTGHQVAHNLGVAPHVVIVKKTNSTGSWFVWFKDITASDEWLTLNGTGSIGGGSGVDVWGTHTDAHFVVGDNSLNNDTGDSYVAYLFAHNNGDGEFGDDGDQDIIKCGSYTGNGSTTGPIINLGFEPQWLMIKASSGSTGNWYMYDSMRGLTAISSNDAELYPSSSGSEFAGRESINVTATGFQLATTNTANNANGSTYIYIAIRRGPMKTPESGTEVFDPFAFTGTYVAGARINTPGFPADMLMHLARPDVDDKETSTRLTDTILKTNTTDAESTTDRANWDNNTGWRVGTNTGWVGATDHIIYAFRRAPGFFDVVAYTGTGSARTVTHNLGVEPELMIVKRRDNAGTWVVYVQSLGNTTYLRLDKTNAEASDGGVLWNSTTPTSSVFSIGTEESINYSGSTYIAYLFATLPGISKVGSYTGNGTSQTIDCGFSAGARFVMTKRTNTTGNWNVWDSERGIIAGNDPRLELNTTAAEDTGHDYIDPDNSGFVVNYVADDDDDSNVSGDSYVFLAIS